MIFIVMTCGSQTDEEWRQHRREYQREYRWRKQEQMSAIARENWHLIRNEQDRERYARRKIARLHEELHDTNTVQGNIDTIPNNICPQKRVSIEAENGNHLQTITYDSHSHRNQTECMRDYERYYKRREQDQWKETKVEIQCLYPSQWIDKESEETIIVGMNNDNSIDGNVCEIDCTIIP